jgi:FMN phosphatase YigB (HAD superfamily)
VACKTLILDYIGTLVEPRNYSMEASERKLHSALCEAGLQTDWTQFINAYKKAHQKYRRIRYEQLKEVTNAIWVSDALCSIGCNVAKDDPRLKTGLNVFFQDFIDTFRLRPHVKRLLTKASANGKVGLISNFTYAPAIYVSLRQLGINQYFNVVVISDGIGWRKPHRKIFDQALQMLQVAPEEAVYVGDSPIEDIQGAKAAGLKAVFVCSQFYSVADLTQCNVKPNAIVEDLSELCENFEAFVSDDRKQLHQPRARKSSAMK